MPLLYVGVGILLTLVLPLYLKLDSTLSIAYGYPPPHTAPTYISFIYGANVNMVLLYGLVPVIPACLVAGILLSRFFRKLEVKPPEDLYEEKEFEKGEQPSLRSSIVANLTKQTFFS